VLTSVERTDLERLLRRPPRLTGSHGARSALWYSTTGPSTPRSARRWAVAVETLSASVSELVEAIRAGKNARVHLTIADRQPDPWPHAPLALQAQARVPRCPEARGTAADVRRGRGRVAHVAEWLPRWWTMGSTRPLV